MPRVCRKITARAFATASSGRRGPVVVSLPEDMLVDEVDVADVAVAKLPAPEPREEDLSAFRDLLSASARPLLLFGGGGWTAESAADLQAFCEANGLPAMAAFRSQDIFDNDHPNFVGELGVNTNPKLAQRVKDAEPDHLDRSAHGGDRDDGLHAHQDPEARSEVDPCLSRSFRTRACVSVRFADCVGYRGISGAGPAATFRWTPSNWASFAP